MSQNNDSLIAVTEAIRYQMEKSSVRGSKYENAAKAAIAVMTEGSSSGRTSRKQEADASATSISREGSEFNSHPSVASSEISVVDEDFLEVLYQQYFNEGQDVSPLEAFKNVVRPHLRTALKPVSSAQESAVVMACLNAIRAEHNEKPIMAQTGFSYNEWNYGLRISKAILDAARGKYHVD